MPAARRVEGDPEAPSRATFNIDTFDGLIAEPLGRAHARRETKEGRL
jgi:hypothetical protein